MNKPKNIIVVGVCGSSASGKTTLCRQLNLHFNAPYEVVSMDRFHNSSAFAASRLNKEIEKELNSKFGFNCEHPILWDPKGVMQHLERMFARHKQSEKCYIFVEGFLLFFYPELIPIFDIKIYINGTSEVFRQRRMTRPCNRCSTQQWDELIWPEHEKRRDIMMKQANFIIDGLKSLQEVVEQSIQVITPKQ